MWDVSKGIILKKIPYADQKYILKIFTPNDGVGTYSIRTSKTQKQSITRSALGQPMAFVEFTFFNKTSSEIKYIKSIHVEKPYLLIPHDVARQAVVLFINEMILQTIKLPLNDIQLYNFLSKSLLLLDDSDTMKGNFPLWFAVRLATQLGIGTEKPAGSAQLVFDLVSGRYIEQNNLPSITLSPFLSEVLKLFIDSEEPPSISLAKNDRNSMLNFMLDYFAFHADFDSNMKSVDILSVVFQ